MFRRRIICVAITVVLLLGVATPAAASSLPPSDQIWLQKVTESITTTQTALGIVESIMELKDALYADLLGLPPSASGESVKVGWSAPGGVTRYMHMRGDSREVFLGSYQKMREQFPNLNKPCTRLEAVMLATAAIKRWQYLEVAGMPKNTPTDVVLKDIQKNAVLAVSPELVSGLLTRNGSLKPYEPLTAKEHKQLLVYIAEHTVATAAKLTVGHPVVIDNGDGTKSYFVLDPAVSEDRILLVDAKLYSQIYDETKLLMAKLETENYHDDGTDSVVLIHEGLLSGKPKLQVSERDDIHYLSMTFEQAVQYAHHFFPNEINQEYVDDTVRGWYWSRNGHYAIVALRSDVGVTTVAHELAHHFTNYEKVTETREREDIAISIAGVVYHNLKARPAARCIIEW